jgi:hypothetical protein
MFITNNTEAWMTTREYTEWLINVNKKMKKEKWEILLLVVDASFHKLVNLSNVQLVYLPPN